MKKRIFFLLQFVETSLSCNKNEQLIIFKDQTTMSEQIEYLDRINHLLKYTCSIILFAIGTYGNLISLIIYLRKQFRTQSIGTYLSCLSLFNLFAILSLLFDIFKFEWTRNVQFCRYYVYLHYINLQYCSWILVLNSFDHLVSVSMAIRIKIIKKKSFQIAILAIVFILLLILNLPISIYAVYNERILGCDLSNEVGYLVDIVDMFVCTLIPFIIMSICTVIMIYKLFSFKKSLATRQSRKRKTQFARTVIGINLIFLVCNLPISIVLIILNYYTYAGKLAPLARAKLKLVYRVFHIVMYIHNAIPFIIYMIFNRLFRKDFYKLFSLKKK